MYFIYDKYYQKHENGPSHPENPERLEHIKLAVDSWSGADSIKYVKPFKAEEEQIGMVHDPEYIKRINDLSSQGDSSFLDVDTSVNQHTYSCALLAAGGCFKGLDLILRSGAVSSKFFLACRPPGHHAFPSKGSGFCIFNNAALGARYAREKYGIRKIAIIDFDAHHGNGTQEIFYGDDDVFYISFHQYPHYPGTGGPDETGYGRGQGFNLNLPFMPGTEEPDYIVSLIDIIMPLLGKYEPDLIIVSAGYDSHLSDHMSSLGLVEGSYRKIMLALSVFCRWTCKGRLGIVLEGGYDYRSTADSAVSTISACLEDSIIGKIKDIDDMEGYFEVDRDYRENRVRNHQALDRIKKNFNLN